MKKRTRLILLIIAAVVILIIGFALYNFYPMLTMNPVKTGPIGNTGLYSVKIAMNSVFFVDTEIGYIMIDAGSDAKKMETSLKEAGIDINEVRWILLTHSDYDHVASLPLFPDAAIYMCKDELQLLNGVTKRNSSGGNKMPAGIDTGKINLLSDGQEFFLGGITVKCFAAPGHTTGSMLYLIDRKYMFTGDAFSIKNGGLDVHPFTMDAELAGRTIERLKETVNSSLIVLTGHFGMIQN